MSNNAAKKTKTIKNIFTSEKGTIITNEQILNLFNKTLFPSMSRVGCYSETLFRVEETHRPISFSLHLSSDSRTTGSVYQVNLPEFAQRALSEIQNYRIIHDYGVNGIYKVIESVPKSAGTYVLAYEEEPRFKIEISPTKYTAGKMIFKEQGGISTFIHSADLEKRPRRMTIKTSVAQRAKGDRGTLVKKLFLDFHRKLERKYQELGMTSVKD